MKEVKNPKKPLYYYYGLAVLLVFLFNALAMPFIMNRQIVPVDYGTFMTMTENEEIGAVEIQKNQIILPIKRTPGFIRLVWSMTRI